MRMQSVHRTRINLPLGAAVVAYRQRRVGREQPAHDLGVAVAAIVEHHEQARQSLDHMAGVVEEDLRYDDRALAPHRDQVSFPQLLMHFRHGYPEQIRNSWQVVYVLAGV